MKEHGICAKCKKSVGCPYADDRIKGCKKFVLEDELKLTNEEWLRQCTTEQLAEWIAKQKCDGCNDEPYDEEHGTCKYCMTKKTEQIKDWLKKKYREE